MTVLSEKRVLLVVSGGIAAYKTLELIRRLRERAAGVRCVLTAGGAQFVTPLSLAALSGNPVHSALFSLTEESEMGHIELSRAADLIVIAPASADLLAKMAQGRGDDLATTVLLATDKPVLAAPAMNVRMWEHPATRANIKTLAARGVRMVGPNEGDMACNEYGFGRMAEPAEILAAIETFFAADARLSGRRALVTSGPTYEPIDPVRYLANRSSGRQGHAIATALARLGAETTLVTGPTRLADPTGTRVVHIETAEQMLAASQAALPVDVAVCAAAVSDWRVAAPSAQKLKKNGGEPPAPGIHHQPGYPGQRGRRRQCPAAPGDRLRGRDRKPGRPRPGQARKEGLRLDPGQRCGGRYRDLRRRGKPGSSDRGGRSHRLAAHDQGGAGRAARPAHRRSP